MPVCPVFVVSVVAIVQCAGVNPNAIPRIAKNTRVIMMMIGKWSVLIFINDLD